MQIPENNTVQQPLPEELDNAEVAESANKDGKPQPSAKDKKRWAEFRQRVEITKAYRKKLIRNWIVNIDYRRGKTFASQQDEDSTPVNLDWSYTKTKQATMFSQVPEARVSHPPESLDAGPWLSSFERKLNDTAVLAGIEAAMDETLPDCINAAGIGIIIVSRDALTVKKNVPSIDLSIFPPEIQQQALTTGKIFGKEIPMETVPQVIDSRYTIRRVSPADFLWPTDFTGSNFDNAPWLGYSGRLTWAEAASKFNLTDEDKEKVLTDEQTVEDRLSHEPERERTANDGKVGFDEIFYHDFQYNTEAQSFNVIHHLVFLNGKTDPVIDEQWQGQRIDEGMDGKLPTIVGSIKKPLRVLTLAYVTDEDIPPSDSAIGRSQVNELNKGRTHINKQRARNAPWTWFDVNRLDPAIQQALMRGVWQHAVPVQGDGTRIIGTVQQPAMHQENFLFDKTAKQDAQELWGIGPNQTGVGVDVETKGESNVIQQNFQTRVGRERAKVAAFFVGIVEVLGSLMCLYEDPASFGEGFDPTISTRLSYSILADSTVLVDSAQRLARLNEYLDKYLKTGLISPEPILKEIATLIGLDPSVAVKKPEPQSPPPPNISLRLTGGDDMMNPLLLAFMLKTGQGPDPKLIEQAKQLIASAVTMPPPPQAAPLGAPGTNPNEPQPQGPPTNIGEAHPEAGLLPTIGERAAGPGMGTQ